MFKLTRRALGVFILSFGVVVPTAVLAQTEQQASPDKGVEGTGHKYGEWSIYNPPPIPQPPPGVTSPVLPFRHPNPDAYRENQQRMLKERREQIEKGNVPVPPPPGSIAPLDPPVTVLSPNIDGLQRSDPNVNGNPGNSNKPDTQVAVGPNHVLEVVNFGVQVFGKSGGNIIAKTDLGTFFGQDPTNVYLGDPRVRFDAVSGRWFVSRFASQTNSAAVLLAVSTTSDPTQLFGFNAFYPPTPLVNFPDQPRFGLNDDKVILGATAYDCQSSGCPTPTDPYNGAFEGAEYFIRVSGI